MGIFTAQAVLGLCVLAGLTVIQPDVGAGGMAFLTRGWVWPMSDALPYVVLQAVGAAVGVSLLNRAYQIGEASHVTVFEYSVMAFGPFFGWWLLGQQITGVQIAGVVLIVVAGVIIALHSRQGA